MSVSRKRIWARVEAVTIALVFMAASLALALHVQHEGSPIYGDFPSPPAAASPSSPHRSAAPLKPSERLIQARFQQPSTLTPSTPEAPRQPRPPGTKPPAGQAPRGVWTFCQPVDGGLACKGATGTFTCTTSADGDTSCEGGGLSIGCSTEPNTGARECDTATDSWRCLTNSDTGRTGCAGTNGSYSCAPTPNGAESCAGLHQFNCYDFIDGRSCGTVKAPAPDCFFEPIFGVFCRT